MKAALKLLAAAPVLLAALASARLAPALESVRARPGTAAAALAPRTVILVRHAEKAGDDPKDPTLSAAGAQRAEALARLLARSRPTRLVVSEYKRTQQTLAPLAQALGLDVSIVPAGERDALVAGIQGSEPGTTWVVAGHSNTLPALAQGLGVTLPDLQASAQGAVLGDGEYDRLFVLTLNAPGSECAPSVLELRYGS